MIDDNQNTSLNTRENVVSDLEEREWGQGDQGYWVERQVTFYIGWPW